MKYLKAASGRQQRSLVESRYYFKIRCRYIQRFHQTNKLGGYSDVNE